MKLSGILKQLLMSLYSSLKRFPIAIGLASSVTVLLIVLTHNDQNFSKDTQELLGRIAMLLALGIPVSLCIKLLFERTREVKIAGKLAAYLIAAAVLVLYYFFLLKDFGMVSVTRYIALSTVFYSIFLFVPYFYKRTGFELYIIKLFTRFFVTVLYAVVLYIGMAAILFTIDKLFGAHVSEKLYLDIWYVVAGVFASSFFLAGVPLHVQTFDTSGYPKLLKVLLLYIIMPIIAVYTAILYVYFAKLVITLQWPVGMVAHLVLWYSTISAVVLFMISPLVNENKWVKLFVFWLSKSILPLLVMMFISVGIRVRAYGITENRYFVIALGLWVLGIMIYLALSGPRRNIILPVSFAVIAFLSVIGPWNSYSVSRFSQNMRFESFLTKHNMIRDHKIVKAGISIPEEDKKEISRILSYFSKSHKLSDIRYLPKDFKIDDMQNLFGFSYADDFNYRPEDSEYFAYSTDAASSPIDIKGYDFLFTIRSYSPRATQPDNGLEATYDNKSYEIKITAEGSEIYRNSLQGFVEQFHKNLQSAAVQNPSPEEAAWIDENENVKIKIVLQNINGREDRTSGKLVIDSVDFQVLVHLKQ